MDTRRIVALFALILIALPAFGYSFEDLQWNGLMEISLDKEEFLETEAITGNVVIDNLEQYPIVGQRLVFQVGQGAYTYPSQFASDNTTSEQAISDIWVLPSSNKSIPFSIPAQKAGEYHLDVYSWVLKSKYVGASAIMYNPQSVNFKVKGNNAEGKATIVRSTTVFGNGEKWIAGPVGFPIKAGEKYAGKIFVRNDSTKTKSAMKLSISLCDWAIVFCETAVQNDFEVPTLAPGQETQIDVELTAPMIPSAYEINMILKEGESIESIYKNRIIVTGGTTKARKVYVNGLADRNYLLNVYIAGSPDHFTNPDFNDFTLTVEVYNEAQLLEEKSINIQGIGPEEVLMHSFDVTDQMFTKACIKAKKGGEVFESECFTVPLKELQDAYDAAFPELVKVEWNYDEAFSALNVNLTKETKPVNARVRIFSSTKTLILENISQASPFTKSYTIQKGDLTMTVDDLDAKKQQVFNLTLNLGEKTQLASEVDPNAAEAGYTGNCTMNVCSNAQICEGISYNSPQGVCCSGACIEGVSGTGLIEEEIPFIFFIALIMIILAATIGAGVMVKAKKKGALK
ncbi:MAG: hypothetical protein AABW59_01170 [archaeon]